MYMRTSECSCKKRRRKKLREQETHSRYVRELLDFIEKSPGCFHLTANMASALTQAGYVRLYERKPWEVRPGGKYFVIRNGSSLAAFAGTEKGDGRFPYHGQPRRLAHLSPQRKSGIGAGRKICAAQCGEIRRHADVHLA